MIQRIFHPIGQGAFYSERHDKFNIVYDCGVLPETNLSEKVVKQSFFPEESIDILFISHFDADHVNRIGILKKHCKEIRNVILPLLHDDVKLILNNFYSVMNLTDSASLITNPEDYFDESKIIYVDYSTENSETIQEQDIAEIKSGDKINNQTRVYLNNRNWIFIPYNHHYTSRSKELEKMFKASSLDINQFKLDLNYALSHISEIKDIYNKLEGKINENSMLLYSGPSPSNISYKIKRLFGAINLQFFHFNFFRIDSSRVACIYCGDSDLNKINLKTIFKLVWSKVGTIQIPHHGDIKSFKIDSFRASNFFCPISAGKNSKYGHPSSKVIAVLLSCGCFPIIITEELDSVFIEIID